MASAAMGTLTSSSACQGAIERTSPPAVGPIIKPMNPTVEISAVARTRSASSSNRRNDKAIEPGAVIAAAMPTTVLTAMRPIGSVTSRTDRLARPKSVSPSSMTRRRPKRSATDPKASMKPPKTNA